MNVKEILDQALGLKPQDRLSLLDGIMRSLDEPDKTVDEIWAREAERRLGAYRDGRLNGIPMEEVFAE